MKSPSFPDPDWPNGQAQLYTFRFHDKCVTARKASVWDQLHVSKTLELEAFRYGVHELRKDNLQD